MDKPKSRLKGSMFNAKTSSSSDRSKTSSGKKERAEASSLPKRTKKRPGEKRTTSDRRRSTTASKGTKKRPEKKRKTSDKKKPTTASRRRKWHNPEGETEIVVKYPSDRLLLIKYIQHLIVLSPVLCGAYYINLGFSFACLFILLIKLVVETYIFKQSRYRLTTERIEATSGFYGQPYPVQLYNVLEAFVDKKKFWYLLFGLEDIVVKSQGEYKVLRLKGVPRNSSFDDTIMKYVKIKKELLDVSVIERAF